MNPMNPMNPRKSPITAAWALSLTLMSTAAFAQPEPGDIGVFADEAGTQSYLFVDPFVQFDFYVVAGDLGSQFSALEFGLTFIGLGPEDFSVYYDSLLLHPVVTYGGQLDVRIYTGDCVDGSGVLALVRYTGRIFVAPVPTEIAVAIGATTPSSFDPPAPGWAAWCPSETIAPFGVAQNGLGHYPDASLIINPPDADGDGVPDGIVPVATEETRFGEIKSRF